MDRPRRLLHKIDAAMSSERSTRVAPDANAGQISSALVSKLIEAN